MPLPRTAYLVGPWLPSDAALLDTWVRDAVAMADASPRELHPTVQALSDTVRNNPARFMVMHQMLEQVPSEPPYDRDPYGQPQLRDFDHLLVVINHLIHHAPPFNTTGLVGLPINAVLDWAIGTPAGFAAFIDADINAHLKAILNAWGAYLQSPASRHVLGTDARSGWFGEDARAAMPRFEQEFVCDPASPSHGFGSWDAFFTRRFRPGVRPVASPDDDSVINNACESAPYRLVSGVARQARFWIKAQPYSLEHMLDAHPLAERFIGGTVYQAFLSAFSYHRWHSPVNGTVVATRLVDGSYYSARPGQGFDDCAPRQSQAYITQMATRALIFIEADNPAIGLMCVMPVGMAEISTCEVTVTPGQRVRKGEQLGMFHFGGSTHCLLFGPEVTLDFDLRGQTPGLESTPVPIDSRIATVRTRSMST